MDFYGQDKEWRFIVRAHNAGEVLSALLWQSRLSVRRADFNLLHLADEMFTYESARSLDDMGCAQQRVQISVRGPIVSVKKLIEHYKL